MSTRDEAKTILARSLVAYVKAELGPVVANPKMLATLDEQQRNRLVRLVSAAYDCLADRERFLIDLHADALVDELNDCGLLTL